MKILVSPAKKLDFETENTISQTTEPQLISKANHLAKQMKKLTASDLSKLMKLSQNLAELNYKRFQSFTLKTNALAKPAAFAFNGDTYIGLDIHSLSASEIKRAQKQLRILSGLYGVLRPLDIIQPYRLEMGTKLKVDKAKNLYDYWQYEVTELLNGELKKDEIIVNCASLEYFSVVDTKKLKGKLITPVFKENKNGHYKIISFNAKRARGMMAKYIIQNDIKTEAGLKEFNLDGYRYNPDLAKEGEFLFTRG
ncbi:MAG: peroxide stress protein YaaA [Halobacteriovoraceae bacterium]|nr:peroxide stress protein YaaA [Halobacteriovoraceae bacterium]|tara:strand:+ start:2055 stop:2813 length:759 start_codon:yes stop_codon:yes gene_type:complete